MAWSDNVPDEARVTRLEQDLADCRAALQVSRETLDAAQRAAEGSRQTLHRALDAAGLGYWTWSPAQNGIMHGYGLSATLRPSADDDFEHVYPEDRARHRAMVQEAGRKTTAWNAQIRIVGKDTDAIAWIEERAVPVTDPATGALHFLVFVKDVTERKAADLAAKEHDVDLARIQRIGGVGGMDIDVAHGLLAWRSPEYMRLHGLPLDTIAERHADWRGRVHPEDRDDAERRLVAALDGESVTYDSQYRIVRANDGAIRWIHARADIERDVTGQALRMIGAHLDVTAEKEAQEALRESREQQVFLLRLSDALRSIAEPTDMRGQTVNMLGAHLQADHVVCYGIEQGASGRLNRVEAEWSSQTDASLSSLGPDFDSDLPGGIVVPFVEDGLTVGAICVHASGARAWKQADVQLVEEVGRRLKDAVERAQAQSALRDREQRLELAFEVGQLASWDWDLISGKVEWNERHFLMQGYAVDEIMPGYDAWIARVHPEDRDETVALIEKARDTQGSYAHEFRTLHPDGTIRWCCGQGHFFYDGQGLPVRMIGVMEDITQRKANQETLRQSEERFRQFAAASSDALWIRNAQSLDLEYASPAIETIYGIAADDLLGDVGQWADLILPEDRRQAISHLEDACAGRSVSHEFRIARTSDGALRWIRNTGFPLHDEQGRIGRIGGISQDVTEARYAARHQGILLAELQHRVRNIMAMIRSIVDRTADGAQTVDDYRQALAGRLMALARVQALLTRQDKRGGSLKHVIESELEAQAGHSGQYALSGPDIMLVPKTVEVLTLVFHELATNAAKHGALAVPGGRIDVIWKTVTHGDVPWLMLDWIEDGVPLADPPSRRGFGSELIEMRVPYELQGRGEISFASSGARCVLELPLRGGSSILETDAPLGMSDYVDAPNR